MMMRAHLPHLRVHRRAIAISMAAALVVAVPVVRSATSARASVSTVQSIVIDGRGNGHGSGLSQWGALGWATKFDKTWQEILAIYYSGTTLGTLTNADFRNTPVGRITVQLTALNGRQTAVISESGALSTPADPQDRRWSSLVAREVPGRNNVYNVWGRTSQVCPAGDTPLGPTDPGGPTDPSDPGDTSTSAPASSTAGSSAPNSTAPSTSAPNSSTSAPASSTPDTSAPGSSTPGSSAPGSSTPPPPLPGWVRIASNVTGPITFSTTKVDRSDAMSPRDVIGVCQKNGSLRYYRGTIMAVNGPSGSNFTFNSVLVDDYVRGVVPRESPASWAKVGGGKGMHALRAQAVAARSYAVAGRGRTSGAKICDTSACQVYGGTAIRRQVGGLLTPLENATSNAAVADTANTVLRYANGGVAWATFSSSNGGRSITSLYQAVDDPGDAISSNPHHAWSITVPASKILAKWPALGALINIRVTQRSGGGVWNGWVDKMVLEGTKTNITVTGDQFRRALGLKSRYLNFNLLRTPDKQSVGPALFIGDSVSHGALVELKNVTAGAYSITWDTKLSRCLVEREGPCMLNNAERSLRSAETPAFAIVAVGHHDDPAAYGEAVDRIMAAMLERGIARVLWVNLSERRRLADGLPTFGPANAALAEAATRWPQLTVLDWNAASASNDAARWFLKGTAERPDLASLTRTGRSRFALFIRTSLDALRFDSLLPETVNTVPITTVPITTVPGSTVPGSSTPDGSVPSTSLPDPNMSSTTAPATTTPASTVPTSTMPTVSTTAPVSKPTLRIWARGENVRELQRALVRKGARLRVDGVFGRGTLRAVKSFQRANRLQADGIVGPRTWRALLAG